MVSAHEHGDDVEQTAKAFADVDQQLSGVDPGDLYAVVTRLALERVPGAEWVSITIRTPPASFRTVAPTDERAEQADRIQYDLRSGPCVDATCEDTVYQPDDLLADERWPEFGRRVHAEVGVRSMLAFRLSIDGGDLLGALNLYATTADAFGVTSLAVGQVIAIRTASIAHDALSDTKVAQLESALRSNREIGTAMGVLMSRHHVTRDQAFDLLRLASQNGNRKLRDVATEVVDTGTLPPPPPRRQG